MMLKKLFKFQLIKKNNILIQFPLFKKALLIVIILFKIK